MTVADLTEKEWQQQIVQLARTLGYRIYHTYDSRRSQPGFPDLVLVRDRVIYVELKRESGKLTDSQISWVESLKAAGAEIYVWRPSDLQAAGETLARRRQQAA
jgi:VRR-NUC domain-containing protein